MPGKNAPRCLITGPTEGIGRATTFALAAKGMNLVLLGRNQSKVAALRQELQTQFPQGIFDIVICDLSSLASVRRASDEVLQRFDQLDILINNAGVVVASRQLSVDGHELMFATNHLGPFLLSNLLLPILLASDAPRMINVASGAHGFVRGMDFDNLDWSHSFSTFKAYGQSKLGNILFTRQLVKRQQGGKLVVNSIHPGAVSTKLGQQNGWYAKLAFVVLGPFFRSPERGAQSSIWLASSAEGGQISGKYIIDCKVKEPKPWALDDHAAARLWDISATLTGLPA